MKVQWQVTSFTTTAPSPKQTGYLRAGAKVAYAGRAESGHSLRVHPQKDNLLKADVGYPR